jgi:hypothetical protein
MKIGITGHQKIESQLIVWLKHTILTEIGKHNIEKGYTSLAIGADQLFANILIDNHIPVIAIIPSENYVETFNKEQLKAYLNLLTKVESKIELSFEEPTEDSFYKAGKLVVEHSDILFAVWNGLPAEGKGGTADIVEYAKSMNKRIIHFNVLKKEVSYINF